MQSNDKIIGRQTEQTTLETVFNSQQAEFLAIYGRRRIGKTFLIRNFFKKKSCYFFNVTGIYEEQIERQMLEFNKELVHVFYQGAVLQTPNNWFDAFESLSTAINKHSTGSKKVVLFFDEFPWMATHRGKLLQALEYYWNKYWSQDKRIKLIICGSSASWIINNIINNKGGLHNRLTKIIQLEPMNLLESYNFLHHRGIKLNYKHITEIYMVTGGVPYYLAHIDEVSSSAKIIEKIAFAKNSFLLKEFDNLYSSLFKNPEIYIDLIRKISSKREGISQEELFQKINALSKGGTIVSKLKELENAGFIISFIPYKNLKKGIYYKLIDEYTLFYFDWIEPIKNTLLKKNLPEGYWQQTQQTPNWRSWAGYTFEAICYKHLDQIRKALELNATAIPYTWRYNPKQNSPDKLGAQIDLLFDRTDHAITICEIKYTENPFVINKEYANQLNHKIKIFKKHTKTPKQIFLATVSAQGLKKTMYSEELITKNVALESLFK